MGGWELRPDRAYPGGVRLRPAIDYAPSAGPTGQRSVVDGGGSMSETEKTYREPDVRCAECGKALMSGEDREVTDDGLFCRPCYERLLGQVQQAIGEQGTGLSGGQLQRIVIARAILKNPAILIFDEATSQVDADSEAKIHKAIEEIMRDRTSFIIAHRFSTVITADVIVVMDGGQITAQGQHDELIQSCTLYQSLYETQLVAPK